MQESHLLSSRNDRRGWKNKINNNKTTDICFNNLLYSWSQLNGERNERQERPLPVEQIILLTRIVPQTLLGSIFKHVLTIATVHKGVSKIPFLNAGRQIINTGLCRQTHVHHMKDLQWQHGELLVLHSGNTNNSLTYPILGKYSGPGGSEAAETPGGEVHSIQEYSYSTACFIFIIEDFTLTDVVHFSVHTHISHILCISTTLFHRIWQRHQHQYIMDVRLVMSHTSCDTVLLYHNYPVKISAEAFCLGRL